jgi:plastocyanin
VIIACNFQPYKQLFGQPDIEAREMRATSCLRFSRWFVMLLIFVTAGCGSSHPATSSSSQSVLPKTGAATVNIPGDRFVPFVTQVTRGGVITFHNGDTDAHTVTSVPGAPSRFDVRIEGGATVILPLSVSGAYRYFCSIHARYDPQTDQIAAKGTADHPDEPMAGVLVVT